MYYVPFVPWEASKQTDGQKTLSQTCVYRKSRILLCASLQLVQLVKATAADRPSYSKEICWFVSSMCIEKKQPYWTTLKDHVNVIRFVGVTDLAWDIRKEVLDHLTRAPLRHFSVDCQAWCSGGGARHPCSAGLPQPWGLNSWKRKTGCVRWKSKVESRELRVEIYIYIFFLTEKHLKEFKQIRADFEHSEALGLAALLRSLRCHGLTFAKLDFWRLCGGSNA